MVTSLRYIVSQRLEAPPIPAFLRVRLGDRFQWPPDRRSTCGPFPFRCKLRTEHPQSGISGVEIDVPARWNCLEAERVHVRRTATCAPPRIEAPELPGAYGTRPRTTCRRPAWISRKRKCGRATAKRPSPSAPTYTRSRVRDQAAARRVDVGRTRKSL